MKGTPHSRLTQRNGMNGMIQCSKCVGSLRWKMTGLLAGLPCLPFQVGVFMLELQRSAYTLRTKRVEREWDKHCSLSWLKSLKNRGFGRFRRVYSLKIRVVSRCTGKMDSEFWESMRNLAKWEKNGGMWCYWNAEVRWLEHRNQAASLPCRRNFAPPRCHFRPKKEHPPRTRRGRLSRSTSRL